MVDMLTGGATCGLPIVVLDCESFVCYCVMLQYVFFFFSSRRRHTRFDCDWSSDVCSSDLQPHRPPRGLAICAVGIAQVGAREPNARRAGRLSRPAAPGGPPTTRSDAQPAQIGRASCRERV